MLGRGSDKIALKNIGAGVMISKSLVKAKKKVINRPSDGLMNGQTNERTDQQMDRQHNTLLIFLVADTRLYTLPCWSICPSVSRSVIFLNCKPFMHYYFCQTVRDAGAVYLGLLRYVSLMKLPSYSGNFSPLP